ncbi:glycoside hydrolase family 13 protein [Pseudokineococcus sp. 5B2Z-1]|uniref:glycoside hydrolase family 13 protein n=1 Tax=Pseudokineococcus sp. 5B2Z-1 TaxID=3132744 RepID=UPI00309EC2A5
MSTTTAPARRVPASAPVTSPTPAAPQARDWWRRAVVYQVYPRSFADADGDGLGDLRGITSRVGHLAALGVDAVWLSPFYPSALADGGYDVDDHRAVDPRLGTLEDFDAMVRALHAAGIRVVVDIVPNHTSDRHAWFREALASPPGSRARGRYVFRDGRGPGGDEPPSSWRSIFGGSAWQRVVEADGTPGQWYLHIFAPEQPDLDWSDEEVREDMLETLRFWADRGVDGFRVDVAHGLVKDVDGHLDVHVEILDTGVEGGNHPLWDRDEVQEVYAQWRRDVLDAYDPPRSAVAEASVHPDRRARYADPLGLGQAFNFDLFACGWDAGEMRRAIDGGLAQMAAGSSATWTLSNHDSVRHTTRFGVPPREGVGSQEAAKAWVTSDGRDPVDLDLGLRRARAALLLELALPGAVYLYQGEELGLHEVADIPWDAVEDPIAVRSGGEEKGRDGCRVALPWTQDGPTFGFGPEDGALPGMRQPAWFGVVSAAAQDGVPGSTLELYRAALRRRRELTTDDDALTWVDDAPDVLHLERPGGWRSVTNLSEVDVALPAGELLLASDAAPDASDVAQGRGVLAPGTSVWMR